MATFISVVLTGLVLVGVVGIVSAFKIAADAMDSVERDDGY